MLLNIADPDEQFSLDFAILKIIIKSIRTIETRIDQKPQNQQSCPEDTHQD